MIVFQGNVFHLSTRNTSYIFSPSRFGFLENHHYGGRIRATAYYDAIREKNDTGCGGSVSYSLEKPNIQLENICMESSGVGKGDYREPFAVIENADSTFVNDFLYVSHEIKPGKDPVAGLPASLPGEDCHTLSVLLRDDHAGLELTLYYSVFEHSDVIARRCVLKNTGNKPVKIHRLLSYQLDLPTCDYDLLSFDGTWTRERHVNTHPLLPGMTVIDSKTGTSSNRHNPFFALKAKDCQQDFGRCYGFNLLYSGNHYAAAEVSPHNKTRITAGINPFCFQWTLGPGEEFCTPEAVMSFSDRGLNGLSLNFHHFVREHIIRGEWKTKERPVLVNNWEGTYFNFNEEKLVAIAKEAARLGVEMFVLDDGWFGKRDDDHTSLGDWFVDKAKLPGGLKGLTDKITALGLTFGLWVEPEMVSPRSRLFELHPDWAVTVPGREPTLGRNQLILDYTRKEVRDYIVSALSDVFSQGAISYIKWDMNRWFTDMYSPLLADGRQGEFYHRYALGLYDVVSRITSAFPHILFESCSSGGNRFDLGLLCYMPQVWASDDTDAHERLAIQEGTEYGYPQHTMGAHVAAVPSHQTSRLTPFETRFNVAMFGLLGYELDLTALSDAEKAMVREQVAFYKQHRALMQSGDFYRVCNDNRVCWMVVSPDKSEAMLGFFANLTTPNPPADLIRLKGLDPDALYQISVRRQQFELKYLGHMGQDIARKRGYDPNSETVPGEDEQYTAYGDMLMAGGIKFFQEYSAQGIREQTRYLGDFGSRVYYIKKIN